MYNMVYMGTVNKKEQKQYLAWFDMCIVYSNN